MSISPTPRFLTSRGFSLLEVIIALGIVASVMIALVGVMPRGVESLQEASRTSVEARIAQEIISDAQQSNWSPTTSSSQTVQLEPLLKDVCGVRYYDQYGRILEKRTTGKISGRSSYAAYIYVPGIQPTGSGGSSGTTPKLLSSDAFQKDVLVKSQGETYKHLKRIYVFIEHTPGEREPNWDTEDKTRRVRVYSGLLAYMGKDVDL